MTKWLLDNRLIDQSVPRGQAAARGLKRNDTCSQTSEAMATIYLQPVDQNTDVVSAHYYTAIFKTAQLLERLVFIVKA